MRSMLPALWGAAFLSAVPGATVLAQSPAPVVSLCHTVGDAAMRPVGDRDGHAVSIGAFSCTIEGGPLAGGVVDGSVVYEWDAGKGVLLAGHGVAHGAGALYVSENTSGRVSLRVIDGRVTGLEGSGTGVYRVATGAAAALAGRRYDYVVRATAPGKYIVETTLQAR